MTTDRTELALTVLRLEVSQRVFPPYDDFHGTPDPMFWRRVRIETAHGSAAFEQTDYGHPGRLNPWEPRGIAGPLMPELTKLRALVEAATSLL